MGDHCAANKKSMLAECNMPPQVAVVVGTPIPRKLREASAVIAVPRVREARIM